MGEESSVVAKRGLRKAGRATTTKSSCTKHSFFFSFFSRQNVYKKLRSTLSVHVQRCTYFRHADTHIKPRREKRSKNQKNAVDLPQKKTRSGGKKK